MSSPEILMAISQGHRKDFRDTVSQADVAAALSFVQKLDVPEKAAYYLALFIFRHDIAALPHLKKYCAGIVDKHFTGIAKNGKSIANYEQKRDMFIKVALFEMTQPSLCLHCNGTKEIYIDETQEFIDCEWCGQRGYYRMENSERARIASDETMSMTTENWRKNYSETYGKILRELETLCGLVLHNLHFRLFGKKHVDNDAPLSKIVT